MNNYDNNNNNNYNNNNKSPAEDGDKVERGPAIAHVILDSFECIIIIVLSILTNSCSYHITLYFAAHYYLFVILHFLIKFDYSSAANGTV